MIENAAVISSDSRYRYVLSRRVKTGRDATPLFDDRDVVSERDGVACWIMLNPSTADAVEDDRTIGRVHHFTYRLGLSRFCVVNLFALRSSDPDELLRVRDVADAIGPENDRWLRSAAESASVIVCAWGGHKAVRARDLGPLFRMLRGLGARRVVCLGTNEDGTPRHPLYLAGTTPFVPFDDRRRVP